jgi:hypothetical protein
MMTMIDITGQKVLVPTLLFAAFSFAVPFLKFDRKFVYPILAVSLGLVYFLITRFVTKISVTKADLIVPAVLFLALTPGLLLTLPPKAKGYLPVAVHTFAFAILFATLRTVFPQYY